LRKIGQTINTQFVNLKEDGAELNVALFNSNNFKISSSSNKFTLRLLGIKDLGIKNWPKWIDADYGKDTKISIPHKRTAELEFLLRKSYEDFLVDKTQPYEKSFISQLKSQVKIWRMEGEFMDPDTQRGLLGELEAVIHATEVRGNDEAIHGWDETSKKIVDITHPGKWSIEAKSKTKKSNSVKISGSKQLIRGKEILILSVTEVSSDKKNGKTVAELAAERLKDLATSTPSADISEFRDKLDKVHQVFKMKEYFQSKWQIGKTTFYEVSIGSIPHKFGNNLLKGITVSGYSLDLSVMKAENLTKLFAKI